MPHLTTKPTVTGQANPGATWVMLKYHQDPSHGWVETTRAELHRLGLAQSVSHFSYVLGTGAPTDRVYLEEDCDAPKLIEALQAEGHKTRLTPMPVEFDHPIRCLPRYAALPALVQPQAA